MSPHRAWTLSLLLLKGVANAADIPDELLYYAPFEGDAQPWVVIGYDQPAELGPHRFAAGRFGQGLVVGPGGQPPGVAFYAETNVREERGTVAFWIQPNWPGNDQTFAHRMIAQIAQGGNSGWLLHWDREYRSLVFATGYTDENGWHWNWAPSTRIESWRAGEWHHVAVTWERRPGGFQKRLYLDGLLAAEQLQEGITPALIADQAVFYLGSSPHHEAIAEAEGVYDELALWGRALTPGEVADLAAGACQEALHAARGRYAPAPTRFAAAQATFDHPDSAYFDGEEVQATISWHLTEDAEPVSEWSWEVLNYYEEKIAGITVRNDPPATAVEAHRLALTVPQRGVFKLALRLPPQGKVREETREVASFAVLPRSLVEAEPSVDSPFGGHLWWEQQEYHCVLGRKMGIRWVRFHDTCNATWWVHAEPEPGEWHWFDDVVDLYKQHGFHLLGTFTKTPYWASSAPADLPKDSPAHWTYPPRDLNRFAQYVTEVVNHYKDRIHHWEVWNEPHHTGFWRGTPQEYGELVKVAAKAAKAADPNCVIIGGGGITLRDRAFLRGLLETGALDYIDAFSIHYGGEDLKELAEFKAVMAEFGEPKPLWNTEHAIFSASFLRDYQQGFEAARRNYRQAAHDLVRMLVLSLAHGFQKIFYYAMWNRQSPEARRRDPVTQNLLEPTDALTPMAVAYATTVDHLDGLKFVAQVPLDEHVAAYVFGPPPLAIDNPTLRQALGDAVSQPNGDVRQGEPVAIRNPQSAIRNPQSLSVAVLWGRGWTEPGPPAATVRLEGQGVEGLRFIDVMNNPRDFAVGEKGVEVPLCDEPFFLESATLSPEQLVALLATAQVSGPLPILQTAAQSELDPAVSEGQGFRLPDGAAEGERLPIGLRASCDRGQRAEGKGPRAESPDPMLYALGQR